MESPLLGGSISDLNPILTPTGSDSECFDNTVELLIRAGRSMPHSIMMMIPEAFGQSYHISTDKRAFYEYHATIMEPWDGPTAKQNLENPPAEKTLESGTTSFRMYRSNADFADMGLF